MNFLARHVLRYDTGEQCAYCTKDAVSFASSDPQVEPVTKIFLCEEHLQELIDRMIGNLRDVISGLRGQADAMRPIKGERMDEMILDEVHDADEILSEVGICAHCGKAARGFASVTGSKGESLRVCHPDEGLDCYHLVTVYNEPLGLRKILPEGSQ